MKFYPLYSLTLLSLASSPLTSAVESGEFCIKNEYHNQYISGTEPSLKDTCGFAEKWTFTEQPATGGYCIQNLATGQYLSDAFPGTYERCSAGELWQLEPLNSPSANSVNASSQIDTQGQTLLGVSGSHELTASIQIDVENANMIELPANSTSPSYPETLYGYPASSIESLTVQFGNKTWSKEDLQDRTAATGYSAAVWFDAPVDGDTPITKMWLLVADNDTSADLGATSCTINSCELLPMAYLNQSSPEYAYAEGVLVIEAP